MKMRMRERRLNQEEEEEEARKHRSAGNRKSHTDAANFSDVARLSVIVAA